MFARTTRTLLRPAWAEDEGALFRAIADEQIVRNLATAPWPYGLADARAWIAAERPAGRPAVLILDRTASRLRLIGAIGIHDAPGGLVELGYWIGREDWGRGYATEAGVAMLRFARDGLHLTQIVAGHFLDNPASGRVLRKLGFQPTGAVRMRRSVARGGEAPVAEFVVQLNRSDAREEAPADCPIAA